MQESLCAPMGLLNQPWIEWVKHEACVDRTFHPTFLSGPLELVGVKTRVKSSVRSGVCEGAFRVL